MPLNDLTEKIQRVADGYSERFDVVCDGDWYAMKLQEELGELIQAYLIMTGRTRRKPESEEEVRRKFGEELADVFCYVTLFAKYHHLDLEAAVKEKWFKYIEEDSV